MSVLVECLMARFERYEVKNSLSVRSRWLRSCSEYLGRYSMLGIKNPRGQIKVRGVVAIDVESAAGVR